jgi:hypothetical protein
VQDLLDQMAIAEENNDEFAVEPLIEATGEDLLEDVVHDIVQEVIEREHEEEVLQMEKGHQVSSEAELLND